MHQIFFMLGHPCGLISSYLWQFNLYLGSWWNFYQFFYDSMSWCFLFCKRILKIFVELIISIIFNPEGITHYWWLHGKWLLPWQQDALQYWSHLNWHRCMSFVISVFNSAFAILSVSMTMLSILGPAWSWVKCVGRLVFHLVFSTFCLDWVLKRVLLWHLIPMLIRSVGF